ncbi:hypothetical protein H257_11342 [Aphanomyces astaci]|uniref:Uncharacterized protein n=1 Tax=Aphanomyces astaci TaxID=112090 RepID=W4G519_APHAT|nr:hypothetical protein H257_11342 [Aphanomyces astaci]ETV74028.1 hypothetical protein H257_11342 [Aphanomyces astaci]|eukprot:XP_009836541.1 hypothetical protein H257_11342 [Aphanomyces astaci]
MRPNIVAAAYQSSRCFVYASFTSVSRPSAKSLAPLNQMGLVPLVSPFERTVNQYVGLRFNRGRGDPSLQRGIFGEFVDGDTRGGGAGLYALGQA